MVSWGAEQKLNSGNRTFQQDEVITTVSPLIGSLNFVLLVGWLLASPSLSTLRFQQSRVLVFLCIALLSFWNILFIHPIGSTESISVGLNSVLCTVLAVNFMLLYDPRSLKRLVLRPNMKPYAAKKDDSLIEDDSAHTSTYQGTKFILTWEPIPERFWRRVPWVLDLITSFRAVHWTWNSSSSSQHSALSTAYAASHQKTTFYRNFSRFLIDYIVIDLVKCLMLADPYFNGVSTEMPPPYLAPYIASSLTLYTYRTLLTAAGVFIAVEIEFALVLLFQVNICGPRLLGLNASPATFPPLWGSPYAICCKGLRGFWGETWHQMFRKHFASVGDAVAQFVLREFNRHIGQYRGESAEEKHSLRQSNVRAAIRLMIAFFLSGILHASGSYTLQGPTKPWRPFLFFALQPLGIATQAACSWLFRNSHSVESTGYRKITAQTSNLAFTIFWLWASSSLLLHDLSTGGMWMVEPVPVSIIRSFGLSKDRKLWRW